MDVPVVLSTKKRPPKAGGIVFDAERKHILLVQQLSGKWGLPKGSLQTGESILSAAKREIKEETGINLNKMTHGTHYLVSDETFRIGRTTFFVFVILRTPVFTNKPDPKEVSQFGWIPVRELDSFCRGRDCNHTLMYKDRITIGPRVLNTAGSLTVEQPRGTYSPFLICS